MLNKIAKQGIIYGIALTLITGTAIVSAPPVADAAGLSLKKVFKKKKIRLKNNPLKKLGKSKVFKNVIVPLAIGAVLQRSGVSGAFGVAIAVAIAGAPESFQRDMARTYSDDWRWSGCINCRKRRIVVVPGRDVSKKRQKAVSDRVVEEIKDIQRALKTVGLYSKKVDGDYGKGTKAGVSKFQTSISAEETGWLTARQRATLFTQAEEAGLVRQAVTLGVGVEATSASATRVVTPDIEPIPEYKLANSQFLRFSDSYLMAGPLTSVLGAELREDGVMLIRVKSSDIQGGKETVLFANAEQLFAQPHAVSDEWAKLVLHDEETGIAFTLNILDEFSNSADALAWMGEVDKKVAILAKLTGREVRESEPVVIAEGIREPAQPEQPVTQEIALAEPEVEDDPAVEAQPSSDGEDIASVASPQVEDEVPAEPELGVQIASLNPEDIFVDKTNFGTSVEDAGPNVCRENVYVSFNFPSDVERISHYNIVPPGEILQMDNGDTTAYFTGTCVQGTYDYKYVYVEHSETEKTWKHIVKEGEFEIASNSEHCEVNMSKKSDEAKVICF